MSSSLLPSLIPGLLLGIGGMALLMFGVLSKRNQATATTVCSVILLVLAAAFSFNTPDGFLFGGLLKISTFTRYADLLVYLAAAAALILSTDFNRREGMARFEFPILVLFAVLGMIVMVSAADLMSLYVGFELQSLALYILAASARDSLRSTEAGLKYFVLGRAGLRPAHLRHLAGLWLCRHDEFRRTRGHPLGGGGLWHGHRHRLRADRPCLQNFRGSVPYVDAGCV